MHAGKGGGWHGLPLAGRDGAGFESSFTHRMAQAVAVCGDRAFLAVLEFGSWASFPRWPGKGAPMGLRAALCTRLSRFLASCGQNPGRSAASTRRHGAHFLST